MIALLILLIVVAAVLMVATIINRRNKPEEPVVDMAVPEECCGAHEVCDKDSLLAASAKPEYFDDEELDSLAGISPENLTETQHNMLNDVFLTLKENEVASWLKSLQIRNIQLPIEIREQALMIVSERRA